MYNCTLILEIQV